MISRAIQKVPEGNRELRVFLRKTLRDHYQDIKDIVYEAAGINLDNIDEGDTNKFAAESGADKTADHEAATIVGQGALALLDAVDTGQIVNTAVTEAKLASLAVTLAKLAANSVDKDKLTVLGVDADGKLVLGQIGSGDADDISASATRKWAGEDGATVDQTGAEIKTAYEVEADAYTDTKNTKLSGVATGAEVNAPSVGCKINYTSWAGANPGEIYFHGFNAAGAPADVNGWVYFKGSKVTLPKNFVNTNAAGKGYLVYDSAQTFDDGRPYGIIHWTAGAWKTLGGITITINNTVFAFGTAYMSGAELIDEASIWMSPIGVRELTDFNADVTGDHEAANITSQGALATLNTVNTAQIDNDAITASKILALEIGTGHLAALAVTAGKIAALAIETDKIAANAVTAGKILVASLGAIHATLGTVVAGTITGTTITGGTIRTASSGRRIKMDSDGIKFMSASPASGKIGTTGNGGDNIVIGTTGNGGDNEVIGSGYLVRFYNMSNGVPFYVQSEQAVADIHYFNRANPPSGAAEVGDTCVVQGKHETCTVAGTPGTWVVTGGQAA